MGNGFSSRKWWGVNLLICKMVGFGWQLRRWCLPE
jgi:hypothetical protein